MDLNVLLLWKIFPFDLNQIFHYPQFLSKSLGCMLQKRFTRRRLELTLRIKKKKRFITMQTAYEKLFFPGSLYFRIIFEKVTYSVCLRLL